MAAANVDASDTSSDYFQDGYIFDREAGEERRIAQDGYTAPEEADVVLDDGGTTLVGYFTLSRPFTDELVAGRTMEYHPSLPIFTVDGKTGLHPIINHSLKAMRTVRRISFAGNGGNRYSLEAYESFITNELQFGRSFPPESTANVEVAPYPGDLRSRMDGHILYMITPTTHALGTTFYVDFYVPAFSWIAVGGVWAQSDVGLVDDDDEVGVPLEQVRKVALFWAFHAMMSEADNAADKQKWRDQRTFWRDQAYPYMVYEQPEVPDEDFSPPVMTKGDMLFWGDGRYRQRVRRR